MRNREYLTAIFGGIAVIGASVAPFQVQPGVAQAQGSAAEFTSDGKLQIPDGFRSWVFVGAPLTPNGLNSGKANPSRDDGWSRDLTGKNSTQGGDR
jgi:hypothetical protein